MEIQKIKVSTRSERGKGPARRHRVAGDIPAVVYGEGGETTAITLNAKAFTTMLQSAKGGEHAIVQLEVEDRPELSGPTMVKTVQHHPIREHVLHADFLRIKLDSLVHTVVPINLVGHCVGVVAGGVPDQHLRELEIECLPLDTPESWDVDITNLGIGDLLHVSDLEPRKGMTILTEGDRTIIAIHAPRVASAALGDDVEEEAAAT